VSASRYRVAIIVLSDRAASGVRPDETAPAIVTALGDDYDVVRTRVLPDDGAALAAELIDLCDRERVGLLLTTGGTGLSPRDRTPQATSAVLDYHVPGISEAMRASSLPRVPTAMLSRAVAGVRGTTLIVNLPGSPSGALETLRVVIPVLPHALNLLAGACADG